MTNSGDSIPDKKTPQLGAVVLCGGQSSRMGRDKSQLQLNGITLIDHVIGQLQSVCVPIVLCGGNDVEQLTHLNELIFVHDEAKNAGPLEGIRVGLNRLSQTSEHAFVTGCDVPLVKPELIEFLYARIGNYQAIVPVDGPRVFGMTAIYRTDVIETVEHLLQEKQLRVKSLCERLKTIFIDVSELKTVDPDLDSLLNINDEAQYQEVINRQPNNRH